MKSQDMEVIISFDEDELDLLQENTGEMAESFGLDNRIMEMIANELNGFYIQDLIYLEEIIGDLKNEPDKALVNRLYEKITKAIEQIERNQS